MKTGYGSHPISTAKFRTLKFSYFWPEMGKLNLWHETKTMQHTHKLPLLKLFFSISSKPLTLLPEKDEG